MTRDDFCDRCGAHLGECACDARRELEDALAEAMGRGTRASAAEDRKLAEELRHRAVALARRVEGAIREHVEQIPRCPHCSRCPALFLDLMSAQRACEDIVGSLDMLEQFTRSGRFGADTGALAVLSGAARRCLGTLSGIADRMGSLMSHSPRASARRETPSS
jgi:hypothetical protein